MSIDNDLWHALYNDAVKDCTQHRLRAHEQTLRVIQLESQRRSLIAHLKWAAEELIEKDIRTGKRYLEVARELESEYVEEARRVPTSAAPSGPPNQAGSSAVSETAAQLEGPEALPVSDRSSFLPPAVRYEGNWDDCALTKHQAD